MTHQRGSSDSSSDDLPKNFMENSIIVISCTTLVISAIALRKASRSFFHLLFSLRRYEAYGKFLSSMHMNDVTRIKKPWTRCARIFVDSLKIFRKIAWLAEEKTVKVLGRAPRKRIVVNLSFYLFFQKYIQLKVISLPSQMIF